MLAHFRRVHLKQDRPQCQQPNCNFSTNDHGVLRVHLFNEHSLGTALFALTALGECSTIGGSLRGIWTVTTRKRTISVPPAKSGKRGKRN